MCQRSKMRIRVLVKCFSLFHCVKRRQILCYDRDDMEKKHPSMSSVTALEDLLILSLRHIAVSCDVGNHFNVWKIFQAACFVGCICLKFYVQTSLCRPWRNKLMHHQRKTETMACLCFQRTKTKKEVMTKISTRWCLKAFHIQIGGDICWSHSTEYHLCVNGMLM